MIRIERQGSYPDPMDGFQSGSGWLLTLVSALTLVAAIIVALRALWTMRKRK